MDYMTVEFVPQRENVNIERSHLKILVFIIVNGKVIARNMHHTVYKYIDNVKYKKISLT